MADRTVSVRLQAVTGPYEQAMRRAGQTTQQFGSQTLNMARQHQQAFTTVGLALGAFGAATTMLARRSVQDFTAFESASTKMITQVGIARDQVAEWEQQLLRLPDAGRGPIELADAMFFVTSAGLRGADAMDALEYSSKASAVGLGETATVADIVTSAVNAYGTETMSASGATDVLLAAVREGKASAPEFAGALGRVLPVASEMGVAFEDVGAAVAGMTRTGSDAATATTQLRAMLVSLLKPAQQSEEALEGLGLSSAELRDVIQQDGLHAALLMLREAVGDNDEVIARIFPNVRALSGFLDLMGASAEQNGQIFERMSDTVGLTDEAFREWSTTTEASLSRFSASAQAARVAAGEDLAPALRFAADMGTGAAAAFIELPDPLRRTAVLGGAAAGGLSLVAGAALILLPRIAMVRDAMITLNVTKAATLFHARNLQMFLMGPWGLAIAAAAVATAGWAASLQNAADVAEQTRAPFERLVSTGADAAAQWSLVETRFREVSRSSGFLADAGAMIRQMFTGEITLAKDQGEILAAVLQDLATTSGPAAVRELLAAGEAAGKLRVEADGSVTVISHMGDAVALTTGELNDLLGVTEAVAKGTGEGLYWSFLAGADGAGEFGDELSSLGLDAETAGEHIGELSDLMEAHQAVITAYASPLAIYQQALADKNAAEQEAYDQTAKVMQEQGLEVEAFSASAQLSLAEYAQAVEDRNNDIIQANANFLEVTRRFGGDVTQILMEMGEEGIRIAADMATGSDRESLRMAEALRTNSRLAKSWTGVEMDELAAAMEDTLDEGGRRSANALARRLGVGVEKVVEIAGQYGIKLAEGVNPIIVGIGGERVAVPQRLARMPRGWIEGNLQRNQGGRVPWMSGAQAGRDSVPAMLTPDEHVWTDKEVAAAGGHGAVEAMRRMALRGEIGGMQTGGRVTGNLRGLNLEFLRRLQAWAGAVGQTYHVGSGYRSLAQQQVLYNRWLARVPGQAQAAPPGRSMHNFGLASDGNRWGGRNPGRFRLRYPMSFEPWHVEPFEARQWAGRGGATFAGGDIPGMHVELPKPPKFPHNGIMESADRVYGKLHEMAQKFADENTFAAAFDTGDAPSASSGTLQRMAQDMLAKRGWSAHWNAFNRLVQKESSWNPRAQNPRSTAYGLGQFLNSTWGTVGMSKTSDPALQLEAMMRYIANRYGNPSNALGFHNRNNWYGEGGKVGVYDQGGMLPTGWSIAGNFTGKPEPVGGVGSVTVIAEIDGRQFAKATAKDMSAAQHEIRVALR